MLETLSLNSLDGYVLSARVYVPESMPRRVLLLVSAGSPVDAVIKDLLPHLAPGDLIMDGGNSFFADTDARAQALAEKRVLYMGVGISGGEFAVRGSMTAYDIKTGKQAWRAYSVGPDNEMLGLLLIRLQP